ncbi:hypothetical protein COOONC_04974, partial [Cooperia oncophora]
LLFFQALIFLQNLLLLWTTSRVLKELGDYLNFLRTNDTAYLKYFEWAKDYRLSPTYTSTALCELCTDIYHKESLIIDDIAQYYTHNQCSYNE